MGLLRGFFRMEEDVVCSLTANRRMDREEVVTCLRGEGKWAAAPSASKKEISIRKGIRNVGVSSGGEEKVARITNTRYEIGGRLKWETESTPIEKKASTAFS